MINIEDFITALKTTWVRKLIINNSLWSTILQPSVNVQSQHTSLKIFYGKQKTDSGKMSSNLI